MPNISKNVLRVEYFEPKLEKWIGLWTTSNLDDKKSLDYHMRFPIIGNPSRRCGLFEKSGIRKIKYKPIEIFEEV